MAEQYLSEWNTKSKQLSLVGLCDLAISVDGAWLAARGSECIYILCAMSGSLLARLFYPEKSVGINWDNDVLVCAYEDGSLMNLWLQKPEVRPNIIPSILIVRTISLMIEKHIGASDSD